MPPSKSQRSLNKTSKLDMRKDSFELLSRAALEALENVERIAFVLGYLLEEEDKSLLLKTPCTSKTGLRDP